MDTATALNVLCASGVSAETKNTLHACRAGHPWNNPSQWRNAHFVMSGRILVGEEHEAFRVIERMAQTERLAA